MRVFVSLKEDASLGWVWLSTSYQAFRPTIKITNLSNNKKIYCEALQIDANFLKNYNQPPRKQIGDSSQAIVMNAWYRNKLKVEAGQDADLNISVIHHNPLGSVLACLHHPQLINRVAAWLGLIGIFLGFVSFILSILPLIR